MANAVCSLCGNACGVVFRWTRTEPKTGRVIRAKNRPFPIPACSCKH